VKPIFVFGSNLAGIHGAGAAKFAYENHDAIWGCGEGIQGDSYGIPTKDERIQTRSLEDVRASVEKFKRFAMENQEMLFHVTAIGCGLAGFARWQITPMFSGAPGNCYFFEPEFGQIIKEISP
jgi:hypothetical protein